MTTGLPKGLWVSGWLRENQLGLRGILLFFSFLGFSFTFRFPAFLFFSFSFLRLTFLFQLLLLARSLSARLWKLVKDKWRNFSRPRTSLTCLPERMSASQRAFGNRKTAPPGPSAIKRVMSLTNKRGWEERSRRAVYFLAPFKVVTAVIGLGFSYLHFIFAFRYQTPRLVFSDFQLLPVAILRNSNSNYLLSAVSAFWLWISVCKSAWHMREFCIGCEQLRKKKVIYFVSPEAGIKVKLGGEGRKNGAWKTLEPSLSRDTWSSRSYFFALFLNTSRPI